MNYAALGLRTNAASSQHAYYVERDPLNKVRKLLSILLNAQFRRALLRCRVAAGVEHMAVLRNLGKVRSVVDIGANRGQFALAARYCFPDASIVSFEPLPDPAQIFLKVFSVDELVRLHASAIGVSSGMSTIHISARDDSSSLLPIADLQSEVFPGTDEVAIASVQIAPLSQFLLPEDIQLPALLKLDVQGYELQALKGCEDLLDCFAYVYAECSFMELYKGQALAGEVIAWLRERSFTLRGCYNMAYDGSGHAIQADFLFLHVTLANS